MAEEYDFEKLAREIVTSRLPGVKDPAHAAAEVARKMLVTAVKGTAQRQAPRLTVLAVCRGVMDGMLILNQGLADPAIRILQMVPDVANEAALDPGELMTWAMEGIAAVAATAGAQAQQEIQAKIDESFMGAGEVFSSLCQQAQKKP